MSWAGQQLSPQAGPHAHATSPFLSPLDTDGEVPPVTFLFHLPPPVRPSPGKPSASLRPSWRGVLASQPPHSPPETLRKRSTLLYPLRPCPWRTTTSTARTPAATSEQNANQGTHKHQQLIVTSKTQTAAVEMLRGELAAVRCSRRRFYRSWRKTARFGATRGQSMQ